MIKYVVFDFDGTLADTFDAIKDFVKEEIKNVTEEDIALFKDEGIKGMMKMKNISLAEFTRLTLKITPKLKNKKNINIFPGMLEVIQTLTQSYKIGILSSNSEDNILKFLKKYNIVNLFEFIFSQSSIFGKHVVMRSMCRKHRLNPSEILYVGDEDRDIIASRRAKIKSIAVTWGFNSEKRLLKVNPNHIINSPTEILDVIGLY